MNCSVCGAMIPDGQTVCPNCGTAMQPMYQQAPQQQMYQQPQYQQAPQQQMYQQPQYQQAPQQQMYQQPMYQPQMAGNVSAGSYFQNPMNIVKFVSAIILFLSPFFAWITVKISAFGMTEKDSASLFKIDGTSKFFAVMILLLGIVTICWCVADFVPALGGIKAKVASVPYIELIIAGVVLVFVLLATITAMSSDEKSMVKMFGGKAYRTIGCWLAWLATIGFATPSVMKMIKK